MILSFLHASRLAFLTYADKKSLLFLVTSVQIGSFFVFSHTSVVKYPSFCMTDNTRSRLFVHSGRFSIGEYFFGFFTIPASVAHSDNDKSATSFEKYSLLASFTPYAPCPKYITDKYMARISSFEYRFSAFFAIAISLSLRFSVFCWVRCVFLTSCCVIVDAPSLSDLDFALLSIAPTILTGS